MGAWRGDSAGKPGQPLTEHGVQAYEAADEAVEVDVHVFVCVAHGDDVVELVVQPKPCRGPERGQSWSGLPERFSGRRFPGPTEAQLEGATAATK